MDIHGFSSHVLVNGRKVKEYNHNGLTFVEAKDGTEFAIEVKNHSGKRVLAIVSVDGLDIVDGKVATNKSRGYILSPRNAQTLTGWRKSDTEVGAFKFVTSGQSYATEKGKGQNNGVIAVKFIAEKPKAYVPPVNWQPQPMKPQEDFDWPAPWPKKFPRPRPYYLNATDTGNFGGGSVLRSYSAGGQVRGARGMSASLDSGPVACASANYCAVVDTPAEQASFDMGTTWGSKIEDKVTTKEFEYGEELGTITFYYASREALKAMGVPLINERQIVQLPQAFETGGYAQPPKNWRA